MFFSLDLMFILGCCGQKGGKLNLFPKAQMGEIQDLFCCLREDYHYTVLDYPLFQFSPAQLTSNTSPHSSEKRLMLKGCKV